jgi:NTP pyrophosphatase (non-canonical NTP hydrolase)
MQPTEPHAASETPRLLDVDALAAAVERFAVERDWVQFHAPKNLVMALTGEVGELVEIFQWMNADASRDAARDAATAQAVRDELADVTIYLVRLAAVLGVDLDAAVRAKLELNARKYPVDKARGHNRKYDAL